MRSRRWTRVREAGKSAGDHEDRMRPEGLTVAVWQPWAGQPPETRLAETARAVEAAVARGADLIVFPELWLSGFGAGEAMAGLAQARNGPFAAAASAIAREHDIAICYGYPERDGDRVYNSALVIGADGARIAHHRKSVLPSAYERGLFATGESATVFQLAGWRVGLMICYEVEFPETVRRAAVAGADLVLAPTALGASWPVVADRVIPTRAFENGVFLAYADWAGTEPGHTFYGGSRIVGPDGNMRTAALRGADLVLSRLDPEDIVAARAKLSYLDDLRHLPGFERET